MRGNNNPFSPSCHAAVHLVLFFDTCVIARHDAPGLHSLFVFGVRACLFADKSIPLVCTRLLADIPLVGVCIAVAPFNTSPYVMCYVLCHANRTLYQLYVVDTER